MCVCIHKHSPRQDNGALIAVMQAGFIGVWGEWYYTAHYGNEGVVTEEDWARRRQVVSQLLQALPVSRWDLSKTLIQILGYIGM